MSEESMRILVVDDDKLQLELVQRTLRVEGFEVMTCSSPIGVTNVVRSFAPHLVLMDVNIPALSGDRLIGIVRKGAPAATRFVLYSASDDSTLRRLCREVDADGWLSKSVTGSDLAMRLRILIKTPRN
jgi:two-component system OmpR family response regulator